MASKTLSGKVAIVTGGTRGIGRGIAIELARRGASVLITYNSPSSVSLADEFVSEITRAGGQAAAVQADCRSLDAPSLVVETARKAFGGMIDILVNNAGISEEFYLGDISYDHFDRIMQTNVRFPVFLVQESLPYLRKGGRIINVSSVCAREAWERHSVYSASKASLEIMTKVWAVELGHKLGVTVNAINPGPVRTDMWKAMGPEEIEKCQGYIQSTPAAPRVGEVDDIAQIAAFLCEDGARWITGSTTCANGGAVMI